jgi:iron complex transport system ATP-binding protein
MILRADKLTVGYGKKTVVTDINVMLMKGQFVCLLGPNGSGKSTILKTIVHILAPLGGEVYLNDQEISRMSNQDIAKTTSVVLTEPISAGLLTAYDVVMLGRHPHTGFMGKPDAKDSEKVIEALKMVKAENITQRYFSELSDGEKQKTLLARALAQEPQLIVLDEPTSHLDARHRIEVMLILRQLTQEKGVTVIASLHDIDLAMKACDVALLIKDEHVIACGTPEDVLKEDLIAELYGMDRATFSAYLGGVELKGDKSGKPVFVVAGAGSGASVYRALIKHGFSVITGILPENDIDFHIATAVDATIIRSQAYNSISQDTYSEALKLLDGVGQIIDAGFPVGTINQLNLDLIRWALEHGKTVHTLRNRLEAEALYGTNAPKLVYSHDFFELMSAVRRGELGELPAQHS